METTGAGLVSWITQGGNAPVSNPPFAIILQGDAVGVAVAVAVVVGVGDSSGVGEGVGEGEGEGVGVGVGVGVGIGAAVQYRPPVFKKPLLPPPPQTIIWLPVHTAV